MGVYVDDLIITGTSVQEINSFKSHMLQKYKMSDLSLFSYYLGIEVRQSEDAITMCQFVFVEKIQELTRMEDCNSCHTQMESRLRLKSKMGAHL